MKRKHLITLLGSWLGLSQLPADRARAAESAQAGSGSSASVASDHFGVVTGRVTDAATGNTLEGAAVHIVGTQHVGYTDASGTYRIPRVPAGSHHVAVSYLGHKAEVQDVKVPSGHIAEANFKLGAEIVTLEKFHVTSTFEGQARAINRQRASDTITTIVASDAAGNLPDLTISDMLSRLAGVSIAGSGVAIRGASADLNSVMLDGERMSYTGDNNSPASRAVGVDNVDADLIASLEVIRALPANKDADAIGGAVNIVTRSALDLGHRMLSGRVDYTANTIGKDDYAAAFTYGNVIGADHRWGYIFNLSYAKLGSSSESGELAYNSTLFPFPVLSTFDTRRFKEDRERYGFNATIDHKLNDFTRLYFKSFFNRNLNHRVTARFVSALSGWNAATATTTYARGIINPTWRVIDDIAKRDYFRTSLGGRTDSQRYQLEYEGNFDRSTTTSDFIEALATTPALRPSDRSAGNQPNFEYDRTNRTWPIVKFTNPLNPAENWLASSDRQVVTGLTVRAIRPNSNFEEAYNGRVDLHLPRNLRTFPVKFSIGLKYRTKERKLAPEYANYTYVNDIRTYPRNLTKADFPGESPTDVSLGHYPTLGVFPNARMVKDAYLAILATQTPAQSLPTGTGQVRRTAATPAERTETRRNYSVSEDISAAYGMATIDVKKLRLLAGMRVERTSNGFQGRRLNLSQTVIEPIKTKGDYTNLFPSVLGTYRFTANHVLRGGVSNTIARPNYERLVPFEIVPDNEDQQGVALDVGNPNLKSQKSRNLDLAYEWYFQPVGLLTVAAFQKSIDKFIYDSIRIDNVLVNVAAPGQPPDLEERSRRITTQRNGATAKLKGVELSWRHHLASLPSPLDGFGFDVNYTYIKGESVLPDDLTGALIRRDYLFNQADVVYNAQVFYEKYGFSARVAVLHNSGWTQGATITGSVVVNPTTYWDASLQYKLTKNFTVFLEGKNLRKEFVSWYFGTPDTPLTLRISDYGYRGGFRFRF